MASPEPVERPPSGPGDGGQAGRDQEAGAAPLPRRPAGYTPFEYVTFTENEMLHEVSAEVEAPVAAAFQAWRRRENYGEWFDFIGQTILHTDDPDLASYFLFYQWGHLPALELYTTLAREEEEENEKLRDFAVDGMFLAVGTRFQRLGERRSRVSLRVGYLLPANLAHYVGPVGVWGDVNDLLLDGMDKMKEQVEAAEAAGAAES